MLDDGPFASSELLTEDNSIYVTVICEGDVSSENEESKSETDNELAPDTISDFGSLLVFVKLSDMSDEVFEYSCDISSLDEAELDIGNDDWVVLKFSFELISIICDDSEVGLGRTEGKLLIELNRLCSLEVKRALEDVTDWLELCFPDSSDDSDSTAEIDDFLEDKLIVDCEISPKLKVFEKLETDDSEVSFWDADINWLLEDISEPAKGLEM